MKKIFTLINLSLMFLVFNKASFSQSMSEMESKMDRFISDSRSVYRLDDEAKHAIWMAYCGKLDPKSEDDVRLAKEVGQSYQQKEEGIVEHLLGESKDIEEDLKKLQQSSDTKDKASSLLESLHKEQTILQNLYNGVVLKGSNHPFVQYAIEYGKKMHIEMCERNGENPKVCDQRFPSLEGRPDLVFVDDHGLWIYEFKPNNSDAINMGERQVKNYQEGVEQYYMHFFPKGRKGGFTDTPDSDHGGKSILEKIMKTDEAWTSDGSHIEAHIKVVPYPSCEERFDR